MSWFSVSGLIVTLLIMLICSCGAKEEEKPVDIKQLVAQKCSRCHFSDRIYKQPRTPQEWWGIVSRMRALNPQLLSEEDASNITKYLQENVSK